MSKEDDLSDDEFAELVIHAATLGVAGESHEYRRHLSTLIEKWLVALEQGSPGSDQRASIALHLGLTASWAGRGDPGLGPVEAPVPQRLEPVSPDHRWALTRLVGEYGGGDDGKVETSQTLRRPLRLRRLLTFGRGS